MIAWFKVRKPLLWLGLALVVTAAAQAQQPLGEVFSSDAGSGGSGSAWGGTRVVSGSQVAAGDVAAVLKLERGGQLRICPKTSLSVSANPDGKALAMGLNTGAMELNYELSSGVDSLLTPDFRLQLISPGSFHLAIRVSPSGDTCLRWLPGGDAAVFVTEMMGSDSYQLSPGKSVLFRAGKISGATAAPAECGCPEKAAAVDASINNPAAAITPRAVAPAAAENRGAEAHLEVDSSFVYRGKEAAQDYYESVSRLSFSTDNSKLALALLPAVSPPAAETKPAAKKESFLQRLGGMLGRLFRR